MPVELEISDGDPWYLSPNVWTVPGNDPEAAPGSPVVGVPCYLWARVTNRGTSSVQNGMVRFYWANPSVGFDRTTAYVVGSSFVTLDSGETQDVLCLTPWFPEYVNQGHECVLAEAFHPTNDPLPATAQFNVSTDRHVAQCNLSVVQAAAGFLVMAFGIHNPSRKPRRFAVRVRHGKVKEIAVLAKLRGLEPYLGMKEGDVTALGFTETPCPTPEALKRAKKEYRGIDLLATQRKGLTLVGSVTRGPALLHVEQLDGDRVVGGLSVLVVPETPEGTQGMGDKGL